jgi:hypothetical protein
MNHLNYTGYHDSSKDDELFIEVRELLAGIYLEEITEVDYHEWKLLNKKRVRGYIMRGTTIKYNNEIYVFNDMWIVEQPTCNWSRASDFISWLALLFKKIFMK